MAEAITAVLVLAFLAACGAVLVTVVIGFVKKRWRPAIFAGIGLVVSFAALYAYLEGTGQLEEVAEEAAPQAEPLAEPTPIPIAGGLGVSRDAIHEILKSTFEYGKVREEDCPFLPCTSIEAPNPNVKVWLYGDDDDLYRASVVGDVRENDSATGEAMGYLVNIVAPESSDMIVDWILTDATASLDRKGGAGIEQFLVGDREVQLSVGSSGGLVLSVSEYVQ